jgi:hypothetical protein
MKILRLYFSGILITFLLFSLTSGQAKLSKSAAKARLKFDHTTYDFGSIAKGAVVTHNYWLENLGTDTLIITKIKPTCGCTSTRKAGFAVPPGERSTIDIVFDSGKFNGRVTKSIKVESNDVMNPYLDLRFKATINNPLLLLEYSPLKVDFQNIPARKQGKVTVNVTNIDTTASKLIIVEKPSDRFLISDLKKDNLKPGGTTELTLTLANDIEPGPFLTSICLEIENKPGSRITIPISGTVAGQ